MMTNNDFDELIEFVVSTGLTPPKILFQNGYEDWRTRSALAKFLSHPAYNKIPAAIQLLTSVADIPAKTPGDIEYKAWSLKHLAFLLRKYVKSFSAALAHINHAINLVESIDCHFHTIRRGELWGERWILLSLLEQTHVALREANEQIQKYACKFAKNNSYLYNAYRFKAQVAGRQGDTAKFVKLMKTALSFICLNEQEKKLLAAAFSAKHNNFQIILENIDLATPRNISWII